MIVNNQNLKWKCLTQSDWINSQCRGAKDNTECKGKCPAGIRFPRISVIWKAAEGWHSLSSHPVALPPHLAHSTICCCLPFSGCSKCLETAVGARTGPGGRPRQGTVGRRSHQSCRPWMLPNWALTSSRLTDFCVVRVQMCLCPLRSNINKITYQSLLLLNMWEIWKN